jgi:hypothetical protein
MNIRLARFLTVPVAGRGYPLFHSWDYLSHFQPQKGVWSQSLGSSILLTVDAASLLGDLPRSRDLVALRKIIQLR